MVIAEKSRSHQTTMTLWHQQERYFGLHIRIRHAETLGNSSVWGRTEKVCSGQAKLHSREVFTNAACRTKVHEYGLFAWKR